jgi:hypothetical protein
MQPAAKKTHPMKTADLESGRERIEKLVTVGFECSGLSLLESARAMSQKNHDSHPEERNGGRPKARSIEPDGTSADVSLWTWLGRPRAWSAAQVMALAMLACLAAALLTVLMVPADVGVPVAWGLAVLAYLLLGLVLSREVVQSFRRE